MRKQPSGVSFPHAMSVSFSSIRNRGNVIVLSAVLSWLGVISPVIGFVKV